MKQLRKELDKNRLSKLILLDKIFDNLFTKAEKKDFDEIKNKHESPVKLAPFGYNIKSSYYEWLSEVIENDIKRRRKIKFKISPNLQTIILVFKTLNALSKGKYTKEFDDELNYFKDSIEKTKIDSTVKIDITNKLENWWNFLYNQSGKNNLIAVDKAIVNFSNNLIELSDTKDDHSNETITTLQQKLFDTARTLYHQHRFKNDYNIPSLNLDTDMYGILVNSKYLFNTFTDHVTDPTEILKNNNILPENSVDFDVTDIYFRSSLRVESVHKNYITPVSYLIRSPGSEYTTPNIFNSKHIPFSIGPNGDSLDVDNTLFADLSETNITTSNDGGENVVDYSFLDPIRYWFKGLGNPEDKNLSDREQISKRLKRLFNMLFGDNQPEWFSKVIDELAYNPSYSESSNSLNYFIKNWYKHVGYVYKTPIITIPKLTPEKLHTLTHTLKAHAKNQMFNKSYINNIFEKHLEKLDKDTNSKIKECIKLYGKYISQKENIITTYLSHDEIFTPYDERILDSINNAIDKYNLKSESKEGITTITPVYG